MLANLVDTMVSYIDLTQLISRLDIYILVVYITSFAIEN